MTTELNGIYAATITPFDESGRPDHEQLAAHLKQLARRGCHGALLCGTTGEGPSLSVEERIALFAAAAKAKTGLRLLAGTGAASLEDTIALTRAAFEIGLSGVVIIPPFFYPAPAPEGLFAFYAEVIRRAVPEGGAVLLYHNPPVGAIPLSLELIARLRDAFPERVIGIKDSEGDRDHTRRLCDAFPDFRVFVGDDRLLAPALEAGGAGAITGLANLFPDLLRDVYDRYQRQEALEEAQKRLSEARLQLEGLPRIAAIKMLLKAGRIIQSARVRPPLSPLTESEYAILRDRFHLDVRAPSVVDLSELSGPA